MSAFAVYVRPPLTQTWADGSPILWGFTVWANSEAGAHAEIRKCRDLEGMPIVGAYRK